MGWVVVCVCVWGGQLFYKVRLDGILQCTHSVDLQCTYESMVRWVVERWLHIMHCIGIGRVAERERERQTDRQIQRDRERQRETQRERVCE